MARHVNPGGVLIVESWFPPEEWKAGSVHAMLVDEADLKIVCVSTSSVAGKVSFLDIVKNKTKDDPLKIFKTAVENARPRLEVKSRRVGGSTYQVPVEVNPRRRTSLAIRWLIQYAKERGEKSVKDKLANEFMEAANNRGATVKKKEDTHRMAEANKAFAHYRW